MTINLDNLDKIKEIIVWSKGQKINRLKIGDLEVEFNPLVHQDKIDIKPKTASELKLEEEKRAREFELLLTHSS